MTQSIHHLADAIAALKLAHAATNNGLVADCIEVAEAECYKALRQIADGQIAASDDERKAQEIMESWPAQIKEIDQRIDAVLAQFDKE